MLLESALVSHIGRRTTNEDSACRAEEVGLFAVADGMGGYEGGEVASVLAIERVREFITSQLRDPHGTWPGREDRSLSLMENVAVQAAERAHQEILARRVGIHSQMGSTLVLMHVVDRRAVLAHVGDSRVYRLREGVLTPLTTDHSLWAELEASGSTIPRTDFGHRNVITRALGLPEAHRADATTVELASGDVYLLCSDGLHDPVDANTLARVLGLVSLEAAAGQLVQAALDAGGTDNITAVLLRVG